VKVPVQASLVKVAPPVVVPEIISDDQRKHPSEGTTPVELSLPKGLGGMKAHVSQETANTLAKTFLGGALVALGVVVMAIFGVKSPRRA
jgi:hypothetical protein